MRGRGWILGCFGARIHNKEWLSALFLCIFCVFWVENLVEWKICRNFAASWVGGPCLGESDTPLGVLPNMVVSFHNKRVILVRVVARGILSGNGMVGRRLLSDFPSFSSGADVGAISFVMEGCPRQRESFAVGQVHVSESLWLLDSCRPQRDCLAVRYAPPERLFTMFLFFSTEVCVASAIGAEWLANRKNYSLAGMPGSSFGLWGLVDGVF